MGSHPLTIIAITTMSRAFGANQPRSLLPGRAAQDRSFADLVRGSLHAAISWFARTNDLSQVAVAWPFLDVDPFGVAILIPNHKRSFRCRDDACLRNKQRLLGISDRPTHRRIHPWI